MVSVTIAWISKGWITSFAVCVYFSNISIIQYTGGTKLSFNKINVNSDGNISGGLISMSELHPSQIHDYLHWYKKTNNASWLCFITAITLFFLAIDSRQKPVKLWLLTGATSALIGGRKMRESAQELNKRLGLISEASTLNFKSWIYQQTMPQSKLAVTIPAFDENWQPKNLITDPVNYIQKRQKHTAIVGGTGDGKSTFTQYLSSKIGGRVRIYDSDAKPDDWNWIDQQDVIGRKGNFAAINAAMAEDLRILEILVELRGTGGNSAIAGQERFTIAEEFPILADECDNAPVWIKRFAKRGRRYGQFICALAQNDTAENFALEGDKNTLYSCFVLVRLGAFAADYARTKLKDEKLAQWLKAGGKKRFLLDDQPCELDLSNWGAAPTTQNAIATTESKNHAETLQTLNEYEQFILNWGREHPGEILKARILTQSTRQFKGMNPDDIRIIFASMADRGIGAVVGEADQLGWQYSP